MERLKIYKEKKGLANFLIVFGSIFLIVGLVLMINSVTDKTNLIWNSVAFTLQGILFILMGYLNLRSDKYFIEWDENRMNYLLPNISDINTIIFSEIRSVRIELFEIHLDLGESEETINLENLQFEHIKSLKHKFEEIRATTESRSLDN